MKTFLDIIKFTNVTAFGVTLTAQYIVEPIMGNTFDLGVALDMGDPMGARNRGEIIGCLKYMAVSSGYSCGDLNTIELTDLNYRFAAVTIDLRELAGGYQAPYQPQYEQYQTPYRQSYSAPRSTFSNSPTFMSDFETAWDNLVRKGTKPA
jgi:hypothetical protein